MLMQEPCQQAFRGLCIAADLDDFVEDITILIDGAPKLAFLAIDCDDDFIEMPDIPPAWRLSFQSAGVVGAKLQRPAPHRFAGHDNAACEQHFLDEAQAQRKSEIQPHGMGDDLRREAMPFVTDRR